MFHSYFNFLTKYRWVVIVATLVLAGALSSGAQFLSFTNDYRVFFSDENPQLLALDELQSTYTKDDTVLFVITPKDHNVFTKQTLASIAELTDLAWDIPYTQRVDSLQNFQYSYSDNDELIIQNLFQPSQELTDEQLKTIERIALAEPLLNGRLISKDSKVTGIQVQAQLPGINEQAEFPEVANYARMLAREMEAKNPNLTIRLTGGTMMGNAFPEASIHDIKTLIPIMFAIVFIILALMLRSISAMIWALVVILLSITMAMGSAGWLGIALSPPSAGASNIILTVAVADCVHMLVSYLHAMRKGWGNRLSWKQQRVEASRDALAVNFRPIFITSLTTALGFLTLNFSDSPPFHDLGNIVAMGVGLAFFLSVVFLPALMIVMPIRVRPYKTKGNKFMKRFSGFVISNRWPLLGGMTLVICMLVSFLPRNELNDDLIAYFSPDNTFRSDTDYATEHLTGMYLMEYSLGAEQPGGINHPQYLKTIDAFADWYRKQPEVLHVYSIADIQKRLNKNMHDDDENFYQIPTSQELGAQYMLLYEMSLPEGLDLNDRINVDKSASRLTATIKSLSSSEMIALQQRADQWLKANAPEFMWTEATSPNLIFAHIGERNINSMLKGTFIALVLISLILIFALKSIKLGLLSIIPNLIPAAMAFGLWGLIDGQINLAVSVVASLTLGIVVDDTVHFLSKFQYALKDLNKSREEAVEYAFIHVGTALWITSIVLIAGFLILTLSDFQLNAKLGLLTAITISFALIADFLFLPPLLMMIKDKK
ncbi:MAG: RND transporter [Piscirickettsiaceae bacterium]|nr:MAG: RND transporter [Piscirickettsiaceae bacterium]